MAIRLDSIRHLIYTQQSQTEKKTEENDLRPNITESASFMCEGKSIKARGALVAGVLVATIACGIVYTEYVRSVVHCSRSLRCWAP